MANGDDKAYDKANEDLENKIKTIEGDLSAAPIEDAPTGGLPGAEDNLDDQANAYSQANQPGGGKEGVPLLDKYLFIFSIMGVLAFAGFTRQYLLGGFLLGIIVVIFLFKN